jgi:mycothiol system anti-sigma-R factor
MNTSGSCGGDGSGVDCGQALGRLFEYLDSELATLDSERVRHHLEECAPCLGEYDVEVVVKNLVRRSCKESAPEDLRTRIHQRLTVLGHGFSPE